jgi:hypothetical protein
LKATGLGAAALSLGWPRIARGAWGDIPGGVWSGVAPATKVLEIHLAGGMAPWESFYYRPDPGGKTRGFDADVTTLAWNAACPGTPGGLATQLLANDEKTKPVHLGPFAKPLWRSDLRSRMRVVVMRHNLPPHEAAIPYALSGHLLGRPNFCGLGVPIQRRARALDTAGSHPLPYSYCLLTPNAAGSPLFTALDTIGAHPGNAKPLRVTVGPSAGDFIASLNRDVASGADDLLRQYRAQYQRWIVLPGSEQPTRSRAFQDYASSVEGLFSSAQLTSVLTAAPLVTALTPFCSREAGEAAFINATSFGATAIRAAAYLLTRTGDQEARYVGIIDSGLQDVVLPYDVHDNSVLGPQARCTSSNLWDTLSALASVIRDPANPSPDDANKIDLATTVIVIKTEFGRTPFRSNSDAPSAGSDGRDHWPDGFVNVILGGPITTVGVVGSILDGVPASVAEFSTKGVGEPGMPYDFFHKPEDIQCAVLLACGIDPFGDGNFQLGELSPRLQAASHEAAMAKLRTTILGVS